MKTITNSPITREIIDNAMDYETFNKLTVSMYEEGRTTNDDNSESMLDYTKLNIQRTQRIDRRGTINEATFAVIDDITTPQIWFIITEGWCGDSAQLLPYINKMAELNSNINLKIVLRDQYPEVMDAYLTNGESRSIPKLIVLDAETLEPLAEWGPRPESVQERYLAEKADESIGGKQASQNLHVFYSRDKGALLQEAIRSLLASI
jgi:hypothetical protein